MRGTARRSEPAEPDLDGEMAAAIAEVGALAASLAGNPAYERTVLELIETEMRLSELRVAVADSKAQGFLERQYIELGRRMERTEQAARRPAPRQRKAGHPSPLMAVVRN